jgi:two-component system, OmpR family, phosphate regulon sensor histidine kinase PhoR
MAPIALLLLLAAGTAAAWFAGTIVGWIALLAGIGAGILFAVIGRSPPDDVREGALPVPPPAPVPIEPPNGFSLPEVLEASPRAVILVDGDMRIVQSNALARRLLRFDESVRGFASVLRAPTVLDLVRRCAAGGPADSVVWNRIGEPIDEHFRVFAGPRRIGSADGALVLFEDMTEIMTTERRRADFLANASHELRTPLASLSLTVETLVGPAKGDEAASARFLGVMQDQIERMKRLIDDLLSLSRIEMDEFALPSDDVNLGGIVGEVVSILEPIAAARGVTLNFSTTDDQPINGDRFQLSQVVQNLIDNAIKHATPGSEVSITLLRNVSADQVVERALRDWPAAGRAVFVSKPTSDSGSCCILRVSNEGAGIERHHLPRLSERFYRAEREDGGPSGTGLGLAIVKHIVARHRGGFGVESEVGRGAAFSVWFAERPSDSARDVRAN